MPLTAVNKGICAINKHLASRQICINQSGTQHSAIRYPQAENPPHIHTHLVFADTKPNPEKTKRV